MRVRTIVLSCLVVTALFQGKSSHGENKPASEPHPNILWLVSENNNRLDDPCEPIRWWAAQGCTMLAEKAESAEMALRERLTDSSGAVQIAAAEALACIGKPDLALPVLERWLKDDHAGWFGLQAANVLDRIGRDAKPILPSMREALNRPPDKDPAGPLQYQARILEHIVSVLDGKKEPLVYPTMTGAK
jgi:hypothetical protein